MDIDLTRFRVIEVSEDAADGALLIVRRYEDRKPWVCYSEQCGGQPQLAERRSCGYCGTHREDAEL